MSEVFDLVVIGGGPGGYVAAIRAAQLGLKTACIEKRGALGGTCLNVGCIPSKALLDSSEHYHFTKEKLFKHGVKVSGVELDLKTMMARKDGVVKTLTTGIAGLFKKNKVEYLIGVGKFSGKSGDIFEVDVQLNSGEKSKVQAKKILIATGSEPIELPFLKFDGKDVISSTEALALTDVPKRMCVVGGGVIGLEMGSVWSRLGSKVTVIEFAPKIAGKADQQMSTELEKSLRKQGFDFMLSTKCLGAEKRGNEWAVKFEKLNGNEKGEILVDKILVSVGRKPYTENLGLEKVGLAVDEKGRIPIDDHFQSKVPGIYAVGDVVDGPMLAHKAEEEGIAVVELMVGQAGHVNYEIIPDVIYTWPELAAVGYSEDDLKARNHAYKVGTFPFMANGRAKAMDEVEGLVKILSDAKTDKVLGVHILGPRASDLIPEAVSVMEFGGSAEDIARTCHAHPTLSEAVKEAALAVDKRAIHF